MLTLAIKRYHNTKQIMVKFTSNLTLLCPTILHGRYDLVFTVLLNTISKYLLKVDSSVNWLLDAFVDDYSTWVVHYKHLMAKMHLERVG